MKRILAAAAVLALALSFSGCGSTSVGTDQAAADRAAKAIDAIYVQKRTAKTDSQIEQARKVWDSLTDAQKGLVSGKFADPDYFGLDTGDASRDDPLNSDSIGEDEILVVSFGTSFNSSRAADIGGIEKAVAKAFPSWSVRRAFTSQIILNHIQARDGIKIDNVDQALDRAISNGVKRLVVLPTHLMRGAEFDELSATVQKRAVKFEQISIAEPLLGQVGADSKSVNDDKKAAAESAVSAALTSAHFPTVEIAKAASTAIVFMGHGTSHSAKVSYLQMAAQMKALGYDNVFVGTVEGEPEETSCENVIAGVKAAGYRNVVLRPLMVVAGDHANNDMAGDDEDSWKSQFVSSGAFDKIDCQIEGLGRVPSIQTTYVEHTGNAIFALKKN